MARGSSYPTLHRLILAEEVLAQWEVPDHSSALSVVLTFRLLEALNPRLVAAGLDPIDTNEIRALDAHNRFSPRAARLSAPGRRAPS